MIPISTSLADVMAKAVAFDTRDLRFESHHLQGFFEHFLLPTELYIFEQKKNKGQESGTGPTNKNNQNIVRTFLTWCSVHTSAFYAVT